MAAGANQHERAVDDLVNKQPVALDVDFPVVLVITDQRMIAVVLGKGFFFGKQGDGLNEFILYCARTYRFS